MKQDLRIGFSDTFQRAIDFFVDTFATKYNVIRDDAAPDYLIFGDSNFGQNHYKYRGCKKIFFTGENVRPSYFTYDFAITFDHVNSPYHYRLPLYVLDMWGMKQDGWTDNMYYLVNKKIDVEKIWDQKKHFCSFVVQNPNCQIRNAFFEYVNRLTRVDSGGPLFNNIGGPLPREGGHGVKIDFLRPRFFNIAFENGQYPGYVTEKILNAYYADTVPVYFGSESVARDFNVKSMINCHDFINISTNLEADKIFDRMVELTSNKNLYCEMLSQPAFSDNIPPACTNLNLFLDWWERNVL